MPTYTRQSGVLAGQTIVLYAIFLDPTEALVDTDDLPEVYIYDDSLTDEEIQEEVDAESYASAVDGPLTATRLSTGYYKLEYSVPADASGTWSDVWVAEVEGVSAGEVLSFVVSTAVTITTQYIGNNTMIIVELAPTIANADNTLTLGETLKLYYTTTYSPLYASPDLVRMEVGRWIEHISDDTLALMIHWASKEADFIHGAQALNSGNLVFAKTRFVVYDAALKLILMPGSGVVTAASAAGGGKKQLGDLLIEAGSGAASAIDDATISWLEEQRREWFRVVNAGGNIVPGGMLPPSLAVKGICDPDRPLIARMWEDPREYNYSQPTINGKGLSRAPNGRIRRRGRLGFRPRYGGGAVGGDYNVD